MAGIACGSGAATETIPTPTPSVPPVVVVDGNGREVVFREPPRRIVALDSAVVEFLFAMGAGDLIAGMHDFVSYPPEAEGIPKVGSPFNISAEKILVVEPDLVSAFFAEAIPQLEELGVKVLYIETPVSLDGIVEQVHLWGRVTDNGGAAKLVAADFESRLNDVEDRLAALERGPSITTTVQGGMCGDVRSAARRLAWERLARSLLSCVSSSHRNNSSGPNRSRGSISRTTR